MNLRCIIVDDEPNAVNLLEVLVGQSTSWQLLTKCYNALDAISFLKDNAVDLIFLDINMPGLDGYEVCRQLKSSGTKSPHIIMISGTKDPMAETMAKKYGADGFCHKQAGAILETLMRYYQIERKLK